MQSMHRQRRRFRLVDDHHSGLCNTITLQVCQTIRAKNVRALAVKVRDGFVAIPFP